MAARDNGALRRAFGNSLQDNTYGYVDPNEGILSNIQDYFRAYQDVRGLSPEEASPMQNWIGPNQFTDPNTGWIYSANAAQHGTAGRDTFVAIRPGELEKARANPKYRAKVGVYDSQTGQFLYEQESSSKADGMRGVKLGLLAVGGMAAAGAMGALGGVSGAGNIGATGAMEGVVGAGNAVGSGLGGAGAAGAAGGVPGNPYYGAEAASGVPANPYYGAEAATGVPANPMLEAGAASGVPANPMLEAGGSGSILDKLGSAAQTVIDTPLGKMSLGQIVSGIAGAAVGAKGEKKTQTQTAKMDRRMEPYIFGAEGQPGLLQYAQGLLSKQMQPEYTAAFDQMRNTGLGLLGAPVAGNGVGQVPYGGLGPGLLGGGLSSPHPGVLVGQNVPRGRGSVPQQGPIGFGPNPWN